MLHLLDKLAGWWLDRRMSHASKVDPELAEMELRKAKIDQDGLTVEGISPMVAAFAEEAARMLNKANAKNYLEFDMFPRMDRQLKPIRVTVQWWGKGKSPAQRVTELERELAAAQEAIIELYDAMNTRDNCPDCGGDGTSWSLVGEEAEPESCQCSLDVYDLLLKHGNLVMTVKEIRRKQEAHDATNAD